MYAAKKRKISGLSGLELEMSLTQLRKLRKTLIPEEVPESDAIATDTFSDRLDNMIALLESRVNDPLSLSFSAADENVLDRLNITRAGMLVLHGQDELRDAIEPTRELGAAELWSDENMYKHLSFLSNTYTNTNETSSRMLIDTFFFRTSAMVPPNQKVVVMLEKPIHGARPRESKMDTVSGIIDYTAIVAETRIAQMCLRMPPKLSARLSQDIVAFFAAEAKFSNGELLEGHIPQALVELVACAEHLKKSHIRGALTTGKKWVFLAVDIDSEGEGATYWTSEVIGWRTESVSTSLYVTVPATSNRYDPALITGILSSWVPNSFSEFNGDKWFFKSVLPSEAKANKTSGQSVRG